MPQKTAILGHDGAWTGTVRSSTSQSVEELGGTTPPPSSASDDCSPRPQTPSAPTPGHGLSYLNAPVCRAIAIRTCLVGRRDTPPIPDRFSNGSFALP